MEQDVSYFVSRIDAISKLTYRPTTEDILRARQRTVRKRETLVTVKSNPLPRSHVICTLILHQVGVHEVSFKLKSLNVCIIDVGGQRNERRKWISHFDNVNGVCFVGSLGEYNQKLLEDGITNRMHEDLRLWVGRGERERQTERWERERERERENKNGGEMKV